MMEEKNMKQRPFLDKSNKPAEQSLQSSLGNAYPYYESVIDIAAAFLHEWTFSRSSGWILKVNDRKKALFYLIPLKDAFKISLTMRESERAALLRDKDLAEMLAAISSSKKYAEGFALQFVIADEKGFKSFELFIRKLITMRL
jgi:hypothetical protein